MTTPTPIPTTTTAPARIAYNLNVLERRGDRAYVGDGTERYWIDAAALDKEVPVRSDSDDRLADEYGRWCDAGHAAQADEE